jgi:hypothetical protein
VALPGVPAGLTAAVPAEIAAVGPATARGVAILPSVLGPGSGGPAPRRPPTPPAVPTAQARQGEAAETPAGRPPDAAAHGATGPSAAGGADPAAAFGVDDVGDVVAVSDIRVDGVVWKRLLIRTHVIQPGEDIAAVVQRYARPHLRPGDWVFVGQKAVSISQRRLVYERTVRPRPLAVLLSSHVKRTPYGRGLGRPATMEIAIREVGALRILAAAAVHVLGRPLHRSGDFYRVAGRRVASIDGVTDWALPPYNRYIVLHPTDADGVARRIAERVGTPAAVVDLNDLGGEVLGASQGIDRPLLRRILADNPLGQGPFRTPLGIARTAGPREGANMPPGAAKVGPGRGEPPCPQRSRGSDDGREQDWARQR